jgi:hypothetical protein
VSGPEGLGRRASAAKATNESGGEAEIAGGVGVRSGAAVRSLRSARGAAHSVAADFARRIAQSLYLYLTDESPFSSRGNVDPATLNSSETDALILDE